MLAEVNKILAAIEANYGLTRSEAVGCLEAMAITLHRGRPGDADLVDNFGKAVEMYGDSFEPWALKVGRDVLGWRDHA
jgi:hypothetical protein